MALYLVIPIILIAKLDFSQLNKFTVTATEIDTFQSAITALMDLVGFGSDPHPYSSPPGA